MPLFTATDTGATGTIQEWTVPASGNYAIEAAGAQGGGTVGGLGAKMTGTLALTEGEKLYIVAGHHGVPVGVGNGNGSNNASGGGASFVKRENGDPIVVAGGGAGGMGASHEPRHGQIGTSAGAATSAAGAGVRTGAGWTDGGSGNAQPLSGTALGCTTLSLNHGGFGGGGSTDAGGGFSRAAGGGGYSGGPSAQASGDQSGGGGGSYSILDDQVNGTGEEGGNEGDGYVNIHVPTVVKGTIYDENGDPAQRAVYALTRPTDGSAPYVLAHGLSDPVTGEYELAVNVSDDVTVLAMSESSEGLELNDRALRVTPGEA